MDAIAAACTVGTSTVLLLYKCTHLQQITLIKVQQLLKITLKTKKQLSDKHRQK